MSLFLACCEMGTFVYLNRDKLLNKPEKTLEEEMEETPYTLLIKKYLRGSPPASCDSIEYFTNNKKVVSNDIDNIYAANVMIYSDFNNDYERLISIDKSEGKKISAKGSDYKFIFQKEGENWVYISSESIK